MIRRDVERIEIRPLGLGFWSFGGMALCYSCYSFVALSINRWPLWQWRAAQGTFYAKQPISSVQRCFVFTP